MLYQSFSGDAGVGEASFQAVDSTLRNDSDGPMFFVTNTTAKASLQNVALVQSGDTLVNVAASRWGKSGANGGDFTLTAKDQTLVGAHGRRLCHDARGRGDGLHEHHVERAQHLLQRGCR